MALSVVKGSLIKDFAFPPTRDDLSSSTSNLFSLTRSTMEAFLEHISAFSTTQKAGLVGVFFAIIVLIIRNATTVKYSAKLPRVREPPGSTRFSFRTSLAYYTDCKRLFDEAYHTVGIVTFSVGKL